MRGRVVGRLVEAVKWGGYITLRLLKADRKQFVFTGGNGMERNKIQDGRAAGWQALTKGRMG
jgi:hypothetical protein